MLWLLAALQDDVHSLGEIKLPPIVLWDGGSVPSGPLIDEIVRIADDALAHAPNPREDLIYEGRLHSDPERHDTVEALEDMPRLWALSWAYAATQESRYADHARLILDAWAATYVPNGNPINENKLLASALAHQMVGSESTESWLREIALAQVPNWGGRSNWQSKRLRIVAAIGRAIEDPYLIDLATESVKAYVRAGMRGDGTTYDFEHRDALSYHCSGIKPLLETLLLLDAPGLYAWENEDGGSIAKSVAFVEPFARGEMIHEEWVNTQVDLDRRRWEDGDAFYRPGKPWDPASGRDMFLLATPFEPRYAELVAQLGSAEANVFSAWTEALLAKSASALTE